MKTIKVTDEAYEAINKIGIYNELLDTPEPEKQMVELEGGEWSVGYNGKSTKASSQKIYSEIGLERKTQQQAQAAAKRMLKRNRFDALVDMCGGVEEFVEGKDNYFVYYDYTVKEWTYSLNQDSFAVGMIYMSKETAKKVCQILNDGLFNLEG